MNWYILQGHKVHFHYTGHGWGVSFTDGQGRRHYGGAINRGQFDQNAEPPFPDGLRAALHELARAMTPIHRPVDLSNLAASTAQEVHDYLALRLLLQGEPSVNDDGECQLRGTAAGVKCPIGWLIDDEHYRPEMEDWPHNGLEVVTNREQVATGTFDLIDDMQEVHDECHPRQWPAELTAVAEHHDLHPLSRLGAQSCRHHDAMP